MKGLTIVKRTSKQEGTIRLRFRLCDGRGVDLYHKSEIDAELKDLDKFTDTGELNRHGGQTSMLISSGTG